VSETALITDEELAITDEELEALALGADPDAPLSPDAVPLELYPHHDAGCLPLAYMPPAMSRTAGGWRVPVAILIVMAFVAIDILGLCITYGTLVAA
jgi:hypothetical protein